MWKKLGFQLLLAAAKAIVEVVSAFCTQWLKEKELRLAAA
jgi:hypothetical protein